MGAQEISEVLHAGLVAHEIVKGVEVFLNDASGRTALYHPFLGERQMSRRRDGRQYRRHDFRVGASGWPGHKLTRRTLTVRRAFDHFKVCSARKTRTSLAAPEISA